MLEKLEDQYSEEEQKMLHFLMEDFCEDAYERDEMRKWIEKKTLRYVYDRIQFLFKNASNCT